MKLHHHRRLLPVIAQPLVLKSIESALFRALNELYKFLMLTHNNSDMARPFAGRHAPDFDTNSAEFDLSLNNGTK